MASAAPASASAAVLKLLMNASCCGEAYGSARITQFNTSRSCTAALLAAPSTRHIPALVFAHAIVEKA
jgi:hypothetical protein